MRTSKIRKAIPTIIIVLILVLSGAAIWRHYTDSTSRLSAEFVNPGSDVLTVAIELSPMTYSVHGDSVSGFDYTMISEIAEAHGLSVAFHPYSDLKEALDGLENGKYDLVIGDLTATTALKDTFLLTHDVYIDRQVVAQLVDSIGGQPTIDTQQKLGNIDSLWVPSGTHYQTRLKNLAAELGDSLHIVAAPGATSEHLAIMVATGDIPYAVVSAEAARKVQKDYPHLDLSTPVSFSLFQTWAVAPGDSILADSLNSWIDNYKTTEAYRVLTREYL